MKLPKRNRSADDTALAGEQAGGTAVVCRDVTKRFGDVLAVDALTLEVVRGEILAMLGPSGCGKTTFLRLLAGFERLDAGQIKLAGRTVAGSNGFVPPERRRVGIVFQDYALFPHMSVARNVAYGLRGPGRRTRVEEVLALVGLEGLGDRHPHELSGGQQQRVALARALAPEPELVLLDEPFSNLDAALRARVRGEVRDILRTAGTTAILVTHDQEEALSVADRLAIMSAGRVHQVDSPERVYTRPSDAFVAAFVGGANLVPGASDGRRVSSPLGKLHPLNPPPPGRALLMVRPESIHLKPDPDGSAVVRRCTFYGHDQVIDVELADGTLVRSRLGPGRFFDPGDHVSYTVPSDEVLAFPG